MYQIYSKQLYNRHAFLASSIYILGKTLRVTLLVILFSSDMEEIKVHVYTAVNATEDFFPIYKIFAVVFVGI